MGLRVWERQKEGLRAYYRRTPEATALYRVTYQERDNLERAWEEQFQATYGGLRKVVPETLDAYLNCGILAHGCAKAECQNRKCKHSILIAFSCKKRVICPSCSGKRALVFAEHLHNEVLPPEVPQRHLVMSLPKRLRPFLKYDRSLNGILFNAAWGSILEMFGAVFPEGRPGAVLSVQTAGDALNFNPHVHGICSDGVFDTDGNFHLLGSMDTDKLCALFAYRVLKALQLKNLITDSVVAQILSQPHSGFSAFWGEAVPPEDAGYRLFLSRYIDRGPIAESRLSVTDGIVKYATKDGEVHEFSALEFLARITPHLPNHYESIVRYYGAYSCRTRGEKRKRAPKPESASLEVVSPTEVDKKKASKSWAALIKRVFEIDPLLCPKCGGEMKIKAFITDTLEVARLLKHLGLQGFTKPKPIRATSPPENLFQDLDPLQYA